jgi:DNA polymerase III subunit delta
LNATELIKKPEVARDCPLIAMHGEEEYFRRRSLQLIMGAVYDGSDPGLGFSRFDGTKATLAEVLDELRTLPFLASRRVVVIDDADAFVTANRKELESYSDRPSPTGLLILIVKTWPSTTRLAKLFDKVGLTIDCKPPRESELPAFVAQMARTTGVTFDGEAVSVLIELVGPEPGRIVSEVEKLAVAIAPETKVTREDVTRYVDGGRIESLWKMLDSATAGDANAALLALERLLESGESPVGLVAGASRSLLKLYHAGELRREKRPLREACQEAGIPPFATEKTGSQHAHLGPSRVSRLPDTLLKLDLNLKGSSTLEPRVLMERLISELSARRQD